MNIRPLAKVVKALLNVIPKDYHSRQKFIEESDIILEDIDSIAPEAIPEKFVLINQLLIDNIDLTDDVWYDTMVKIWTNQINYEDHLKKS